MYVGQQSLIGINGKLSESPRLTLVLWKHGDGADLSLLKLTNSSKPSGSPRLKESK
jgi:hypothetical protein